MDWNECKQQGLIKHVSYDANKATALLRIAKEREQAAKTIQQTYPSTAITLLYDCLRIHLEVLAMKNEYNILNHECYESFLEEILDNKPLKELFRHYRKLRNAHTYYAETIPAPKRTAKQLRTLINQIRALL